MINENSQTSRILDQLTHGGNITSLGALHMFGCLRLSGRILDLRRAGWNVKTKMVTTTSRKRVAMYYMDMENKYL